MSLGVSNVIHGLFMSHVIHEREKEGIVILDVKGRLALGPDDSAIRQQLQALPRGWQK